MNDRRDFDRLTRAWLDLMPSEAPDRAIAAVLQAVEAMPQARPWPGAALVRSVQMNRLSLVTAAAVLAIVVAGSAIVITQSQNPGAGPPSPSPSPSIRPTQGAALPAGLVGVWIGGNTSVVPLGFGSSMRIEDTSVQMTASNDTSIGMLRAAGFAIDADSFQVEALPNYVGCTPGDIGVYRWQRSGRTLTLTAESDACAVRAAAYAGTWWAVGCRSVDTFCLGELDAGTYSSQYVRPILGRGATWQPLFGGVTFSVPDGWANWSDWPGTFGLGLASDFAATTAADPGPARALELLADVAVPRLGVEPCQDDRDPGARTPAAIVERLGNLAGLVVSPATAITVGGLSGQWVDLTVDDATVVPCGTERIVGYLMQGDEGQAIGPGVRVRLILLQAPGDLVVGIRIESDASRFDAFAAQAMPIVETFTFK